jgi:hypothetical protein
MKPYLLLTIFIFGGYAKINYDEWRRKKNIGASVNALAFLGLTIWAVILLFK